MSEPRSDSLGNVAEFTVSEISVALKRTVEDAFGHVRVRGEVSGYRGPHSSGHCYFALKDERARLEAVIWKGTFARLKIRPEEGMEVVATGRLTTYQGSSKYQIVIDTIEPAGAGALMALLDERRKKLAAEGLFAEERKRALPFMPRVIGVVTSPTGAVIRDIIHRIADRFPVHVVVWPVRVQGETTGAEVSAAVAGFNAAAPGGAVPRPDVIIVARGGGSLEDLWGFNDEAVVRAVAGSHIPVISAVGHETDRTLVDMAADRRAPTPTGAAEIAVPVKAELEAVVSRLAARLQGAVSRQADRKRQALRGAARALPTADQLLALPRRRFDEAAGRLVRALQANTQRRRLRLDGARLSPAALARRVREGRERTVRCERRLPAVFAGLLRNRRMQLGREAARIAPDALARRLAPARERLNTATGRGDRGIERALERARARRDQASRLIDSLSYKAVLERGFALVRDGADRPIRRAAEVRPGADIAIEFADGKVGAVAAGRKEPRGSGDKPAGAKSSPPGKQGSLF